MEPTLFVCLHRRMNGSLSCAGQGSHALKEALAAEIAARGLGWRVRENPCMGMCAMGPNVKVAPGGPLLHHCREGSAARIVDGLLADWAPK